VAQRARCHTFPRQNTHFPFCFASRENATDASLAQQERSRKDFEASSSTRKARFHRHGADWEASWNRRPSRDARDRIRPYLSAARAQLQVEPGRSSMRCSQRGFSFLHRPLTTKPRSLLTHAHSKTKRGVRIINCARGGLMTRRPGDALQDRLLQPGRARV